MHSCTHANHTKRWLNKKHLENILTSYTKRCVRYTISQNFFCFCFFTNTKPQSNISVVRILQLAKNFNLQSVYVVLLEMRSHLHLPPFVQRLEKAPEWTKKERGDLCCMIDWKHRGIVWRTKMSSGIQSTCKKLPCFNTYQISNTEKTTLQKIRSLTSKTYRRLTSSASQSLMSSWNTVNLG